MTDCRAAPRCPAHWPRVTRFRRARCGRRRGSKTPFVDPSTRCFIRRSRLLAKGAFLQDILHGVPIRLDPPARVTIEAMWRHANLREAELGAAFHLREIECDDRVVIGPPVVRAPSLNDFPTGIEGEIEPRNMVAPSLECAADLAADARLLARQRFMLLRIHEHLVDLQRLGLEDDGLSNGGRVAYLRDRHDVLPACASSFIAHCRSSRAR